MKTNQFNFNRLGLLFQRYFTERFHTELIYWGIMVIVFMFIRNTVPLMSGLIFIAGIFYAARFFREIHSRSNGIAYFMIPATQLEKLTVSVIMTSFYYLAMMIITYVIGNLLGTMLNNMLANIDFLLGSLFHHSPLQWNLFMTRDFYVANYNYLVLFFVGQSVYLLGGIYFKRNQAFVTFFSFMIICFILLFLFLFEIQLILGTTQIRTEDYGNFSANYFHYYKNILQILFYLLSPFLWIVSYFRLTEKQV